MITHILNLNNKLDLLKFHVDYVFGKTHTRVSEFRLIKEHRIRRVGCLEYSLYRMWMH